MQVQAPEQYNVDRGDRMASRDRFAFEVFVDFDWLQTFWRSVTNVVRAIVNQSILRLGVLRMAGA